MKIFRGTKHVPKASASPSPVAARGEIDKSYKSWWEAAASTEESALATTYVSDEEGDYRSRGWNGDANSYGAKEYLEIAHLDRSSRVLEIGCGLARVGRELAPHVGEWHGADISAGMLARARERLTEQSNVTLHELSDVTLAQFGDATFDFVYATTVFMHLDKEDLYQYVLEAFRILKPTGWAFFDTWNLLHPDTFRMWEESQRCNVGAAKVRGRIQFSTAPEIRQYLEMAGFVVERLDEDRLIRVFARKDPSPVPLLDDGLAPFGVVDSPRNASVAKEDVAVWGWALDDVESVEVFLDGSRSLGQATYGTPRPDLAPHFPRYRNAAAAGFHLTVPVRDLPEGEHTLQVRVKDRKGCVVDVAGRHLGFRV
jgi:ubiquinone/menaquinone biosynthesis C-methylase UbiE